MFAWIKRIINFFRKKDLPKSLNEGKNEIEKNQLDEKKTSFVNSLKVTITEKKKKPSVDTLVCYGDGTGIDNTMEC